MPKRYEVGVVARFEVVADDEGSARRAAAYELSDELEVIARGFADPEALSLPNDDPCTQSFSVSEVGVA